MELAVIEEVLHHQQVRLGLCDAGFKVLDLDGVEAQELRKDGRLTRGRIHVSKVRRTKLDENMPKKLLAKLGMYILSTHKSATFQAFTKVLMMN